MKFEWKAAGAAGAALFLSGCVTYPYDDAFNYCDGQAAQCYRACEDYGGGYDYGRCHASCERQADRCFDQAYSPYQTGYGYGSSPWYGQWGSWTPGVGYAFSWSYFNRNYYGPSYGYSRPRYGYDRRGDDTWRDGRRNDNWDRRRGGYGGPQQPGYRPPNSGPGYGPPPRPGYPPPNSGPGYGPPPPPPQPGYQPPNSGPGYGPPPYPPGRRDGPRRGQPPLGPGAPPPDYAPAPQSPPPPYTPPPQYTPPPPTQGGGGSYGAPPAPPPTYTPPPAPPPQYAPPPPPPAPAQEASPPAYSPPPPPPSQSSGRSQRDPQGAQEQPQ